MRLRFLFLLAAGLLLTACRTQTLDLAGKWAACLEDPSAPNPGGALPDAFPDALTLPGTTDLAGLGAAPERSDETSRLTRRHAFVGKAWYQRSIRIPRAWQGRAVFLTLERTKATEVYLDGRLVSAGNDISTAQTHDLGPVTPGRHSLLLCVDNGGGVPDLVIRSSHMYSEDTQTNWNGVLGRICLSTAPGLPVPPVRSAPPRLEIRDGRFCAGGHPVFLRGKHDACVFPKTGHVPMDPASWRAYFRTCADYGINHVRFHSWCPPEAAFAAADEAGIYLQPELPVWGTLDARDTLLMDFLRKEGRNIVRTYGRHPSFALFSLGNELWGEKNLMRAMIDSLRAVEPRILYTNGTSPFLGWQGWTEGTDYFATCRTAPEPYGEYNTHVRSSFGFCDAADGGILNHFHPGTTRNFAEALRFSPVPVISHETGQFQTYPDYAEIAKYDATPFVPYNLMEFRRRLSEAGMADQAADFHRASGRWAAELYKADIEMGLRTPGLGGFQLLDIQDYPGQGSAYVGVLDAFRDSKGTVTSAQWRQSCGPVVALAEFEKYCYRADETLQARILLANYSGAEASESFTCCLERVPEGDEPFMMLVDPNLRQPAGEGLLELGTVHFKLSHMFRASDGDRPLRLNLVVKDGRGERRNQWPIWVYPAEIPLDEEGILVSDRLDGAVLEALSGGASVLLTPRDTALSVGGLFQTDYWNYGMFKTICENLGKPVSPGTLGILTDPTHPLFCSFPTEEHTSWQWYPVLKASRPMILDGLDGYRPLVQVIDNVERNHRLGLVFEFTVGKGRLLVCCAALASSDLFPEGRQFHAALLNYMHSEAFRPATVLTGEALQRLFSGVAEHRSLEELGNRSYD